MFREQFILSQTIQHHESKLLAFYNGVVRKVKAMGAAHSFACGLLDFPISNLVVETTVITIICKNDT